MLVNLIGNHKLGNVFLQYFFFQFLAIFDCISQIIKYHQKWLQKYLYTYYYCLLKTEHFPGLGRGSVFGSVYGGITAQANNSQFLQKKHKKSEKYDDSVKPFPDSVTQ